MSRQHLLSGAMMLALAAGTVSFSNTADAAIVRHHVHHVAAHHPAQRPQFVRVTHANRGGLPGVWTSDDLVADDGWIVGNNSYYYGYGGYGDDFCGPIQWTVGLCGAYGPYGP